MIRAKICGITSAADATLAVELGAFAIGMVFWPGSPRAVSRAQAEAITRVIPPAVWSVGVFVDQPVEDVLATAGDLGLTAVQLHGHERAHDYAAFSGPLLKSVAVRGEESLDDVRAVPETVTVLLDAHDPIRRGGTGKTIDWSVAAAIARQRPVVLSGGLTPENVAEAASAVRPDAVDVSSGVEAAPGRKDPAKLRAFFAALQSS